MITRRRFLATGALSLLPSASVMSTAQRSSLELATATYPFSGATVGKPERSWVGRAYVHPRCVSQQTPVPLVVFLHGLNPTLSRHAWFGASKTPDLRVFWRHYIDKHQIAPAILAGPTTTRACTVSTALWTAFDLDRFVARTIQAVRRTSAIDLDRVVLVGHSGAGCNGLGGLVTATRTSLRLQALLAVDVCMSTHLARTLGPLPPPTDVVVTYQETWKRRFEQFRRVFTDTAKRAHATDLRVVQQLPARHPIPHEAILPESLLRWIPTWFPPA